MRLFTGKCVPDKINDALGITSDDFINDEEKMLTATATFLLAAVIFKISYDATGIPALYSMMVTFGTVFYHFGMRLAVGGLINARIVRVAMRKGGY